MCTAMTYRTKNHYFGRNLDYEFSYAETVTVTPRRFPFSYRCLPDQATHYAMIGMAYVQSGYPLYYDAVNEKGLGMAGLNFPGNAVYLPVTEDKDNVTPFEFIPWVLGQCQTLSQTRELLNRTNLVNLPFSDQLPLSPLHWMIADKTGAICVEPTAEGLMVYDNPAEVLTNNPPFPMQMFALNNYPYLTNQVPTDRFCGKLPLDTYSRGLGALGLPGDLSSQSRFIRGVFCRLNAVSGETEEESVSQFFHMLGAVEQQRGCVCLKEDTYEITIYSSCVNTDRGIYYYTTYDNRQICAVDMHRENLDSTELVSYPLLTKQNIYMQN